MEEVSRTRDTASAFLWRHGRILLLHRHVSMRSYPGRWSVVSGSVEAGERPVDTARREVAEETGYDLSGSNPVARARAFEVVETKRAVRWRVHSFLFLLHDDAPPRLNAENAGHEWVHPDELARFETVPHLAEALSELQPPPSALVEAAAARLRSDTVHGAHLIARGMVGELRSLLPSFRLWSEVLRAAQTLADTREAMAPLGSVLRRWLVGMGPAVGPPEEAEPWAAPLEAAARAELLTRLDAIEEHLDRAAVELAETGALRLVGRPVVATFSFSESVREALRRARRHVDVPRRVMVARSLPGGEGEALARDLRDDGYEVLLLDDPRLRERVGEAGIVMVGADTVLPDGSVVNKVGTAALARAAHERGVPVVVLADSFKRQPPGRSFRSERDPVSGAPLFERVPAEWIDEIVDEESPR